MPRSMEIQTPLGDDVLLFHRMHAEEELGRSSDFQLDLLSDAKKAINFDDILGKNVTVRVRLQDDSIRHFNGFVTRFAAGGRVGRYLRFTATVSPWAWFLTRTTDCRIFQEMTVREILEEVFADHPMADFKFELTESYEKWNYCVQYRETDFNFVSRLLEHEGIYYYYRHIDGAHTMVLTDSVDKHEPFPGYDSIKFIRPQELGRPEIEHINRWEFAREVQPGVFSLDDYDFERPAVDLRLSRPVPRTYKPSDYEWFDYPGFFTKKKHGEQLAQVRGEEFGSQFERGFGESNARGIHVGSIFALDGFPRDDQNGKHLVLSSVHDLEYSDYEAMPEPVGSDYHCKFVAMPTAQQFRTRRITPKPFVQGPQTAVVVGPGGEEIYTDKYGRVKVQFHWDSRGKHNEQSSCWIRVSHPWAGKGWGSVATPRIGQEVIVDFLEGDPDQPIITGRVYNADNQPPFGFPAGAVISGIKSDTHKGAGYNEMSFDDTAGTEKITIHGQYDMNTTVEHDQTSTVHNCRTDTIDVNDTETVGNNQKCSVGVDQTIKIGSNQTLTIGATQSISVGSTKTETVAIAKAMTIGAGYQVSVGGGMNESIGAVKMEEIGGAKIVSVGLYSSEDVAVSKSVSAGSNITEKAGANFSAAAGANVDISAAGTFGASAGGTMGLKAGGNFGAKSDAQVSVEAASELVLKCGGASIHLASGGAITIKGTDITIDGSGGVNVKGGGVKITGSKIEQN